MDLSRYSKAVAAVIGFALTLLAAGVLPDEWTPWVQAVIAACTALGVYAVPNTASPRDPNLRA